MPHSSQAPEPWHSFLAELDREVTGETRLDCMGGFVVTLLYELPPAIKRSFDGSLAIRNAKI